DNSFRDGAIKTSGTDLDKLLPPMGLFGDAGKKRQTKKQTIIEKLSKFFEKYLGLVSARSKDESTYLSATQQESFMVAESSTPYETKKDNK
ncbi:MAG: hypothetical protein J1G30_07490, partial [Spirochaetales bacterium]|nr:hypothetical protein [Spirochaetales bacterium]